MLALLLGMMVGMIAALVGLVCLCRAHRQHRLLQQVDAVARHDGLVAQRSPPSWQEAQERLAVLRWTPQHWRRPWPEA